MCRCMTGMEFHILRCIFDLDSFCPLVWLIAVKVWCVVWPVCCCCYAFSWLFVCVQWLPRYMWLGYCVCVHLLSCMHFFTECLFFGLFYSPFWTLTMCECCVPPPLVCPVRLWWLWSGCTVFWPLTVCALWGVIWKVKNYVMIKAGLGMFHGL